MKKLLISVGIGSASVPPVWHDENARLCLLGQGLGLLILALGVTLVIFWILAQLVRLFKHRAKAAPAVPEPVPAPPPLPADPLLEPLSDDERNFHKLVARIVADSDLERRYPVDLVELRKFLQANQN